MRVYKLILAGCGQMGSRWLEYALQRKDVVPVALVDVIAANAEAVNNRFGLALPVFASVHEAIQVTGADLMFDTSIPDAHAGNALAAMEAGCSVMMEKPMATSMEAAYQLIETSERTGAFCAVMQNRRYTKEIRSLRRMLEQDVIGAPDFLTAQFFLGPRFGGFRESMEQPLLLDMAIHTFDAARYLVHAKPVSVYSHSFNPTGSWYAGDSSAVCIFEFDNGAVFTYNGSWSAQGHATSWEGSWRLSGPKGSALWDGDSLPVFQTVDGVSGKLQEAEQSSLLWQGEERRIACLDEMFTALHAGAKAETDIRDNIYSVAMMLGAVESAKSQKRIKLDEWLG